MSKGTQIRAVRVADDPWEPARERAQREGTTVSAVIVAALTQYAHPDNEVTTSPTEGQ